MFASHRITTFAGTAVIAAGLGLAAFGGAATASAATGVDSAFLNDITSYDIGFDSPAAAISTAHDVCSSLDSGTSHASVTKQIDKNSSLTFDQANYFVEAAEIAYCPAHI